jgi:hypothetical protein
MAAWRANGSGPAVRIWLSRGARRAGLMLTYVCVAVMRVRLCLQRQRLPPLSVGGQVRLDLPA